MFSIPRGGYYPRPTSAYPPHIQHGRTFVLGDEQLAVRWYPYGLCIRAIVLPSPKGVRGGVLAMGPTKVFPAGHCLLRRRGNSRLQNYDQWIALTSPPEGVFHSILRKK